MLPAAQRHSMHTPDAIPVRGGRGGGELIIVTKKQSITPKDVSAMMKTKT